MNLWLYLENVESDVKVRDHCHICGNIRSAAHRDCNINVSLNYKIRILFHNLGNYERHPIMQGLDKFDFEINVISNGLEKYMIFSLDNKLVFINIIQFLSSSLDNLVKYICENDFKHSVQEFGCEVLDLIKQKGFCPFEHTGNSD